MLDLLSKQDAPKNDTVLAIRYRLHELNRDFNTAFRCLVKLKDKRLFDFLQRVKLNFDIDQYLGKLLVIDSALTVDLLLKKFGRAKHHEIIEECVSSLKLAVT